LSPPKYPLPPRRETSIQGCREHTLTIVTFNLQSYGGEDDTLTIDIDDRRAKSPSRVTIRGQWETAEIPSQLRWIADAIAQHGENKDPATREHVTFKKVRGGAA